MRGDEFLLLPLNVQDYGKQISSLKMPRQEKSSGNFGSDRSSYGELQVASTEIFEAHPEGLLERMRTSCLD